MKPDHFTFIVLSAIWLNELEALSSTLTMATYSSMPAFARNDKADLAQITDYCNVSPGKLPVICAGICDI
jgi:hypothetical protein